MNETKKRNLIVEFAKKLNLLKLSPLRSGNISIKHKKYNEEGFLITPSGIRYESLKSKDIVFVNLLGKFKHTSKQPSSEWMFHLDLYKETNSSSVVHCHSKYSLILSSFKKNIPAFHYMVALAGGKDIRCAEYNLFGTKQLSLSIIKAMRNRRACLISNHGQITIGNSIEEAFELAQEIEFLSECYYRCLLLGNPKIISDRNMNNVMKKILNYKK